MTAPQVVCVLSDEQRSEVAGPIERLRETGIEWIWKDPQAALTEIGQLDPTLVIVGMDVGAMEGLEFLALLLQKHRDFERPVVVLPSKEDPFPPMAHVRDPSTGQSSAEEIDWSGIGALIAERTASSPVAPQPATAAARATQPTPAEEAPASPSPSPPSSGSSLPPSPSPLTASSSAASSPVTSSPAPDPPSAQPLPALDLRPRSSPTSSTNAKRWLPIAAATLVALLGGGGYFVLSGGSSSSESSPPSSDEATGGQPTSSAAGAGADRPAGASPTAAGRQQGEARSDRTESPENGAGAAASSKAASGATAAPVATSRPPSEPLVLPYYFARDSARIEKRVPLAKIIERLGAALSSDPAVRVELVGHTSSDGEARHNRTLGRKRAGVMARLLVRGGLSRRRIVVKSAGATAPLAPNDTEQGRRKNRCVTARLVR